MKNIFKIFSFLIILISCQNLKSKVNKIDKEEWEKIYTSLKSLNPKSKNIFEINNYQKLFLVFFNTKGDSDTCYEYYSFDIDDKKEILELIENNKSYMRFWYYIPKNKK